MGAYHPVPRAGLYVRDRYPPQDLIQRAFELERDRKVGTEDIPVPRQRKVYCTTGTHTFAHTGTYTQSLSRTHTYTLHTVIYYYNKSLAPPNFLWISISPGQICIDQLQV